MGSCCAKDDATPNNPKSTFFEDQDYEGVLNQSLFLQENVDNLKIDNLDRRHSQ